MKKIFAVSLLALLMGVACSDETKESSKVAPVPQAKPAPVAQPAPAAPLPEKKAASITNVDWNKALEMQKAGAALIDVRTPGEVAEGAAPGAVNIPLQEIQQRLGEFPKDKDLVIYCRSGKRSMAASHFLIQNGYERVFNVVGGFLAFPAK